MDQRREIPLISHSKLHTAYLYRNIFHLGKHLKSGKFRNHSAQEKSETLISIPWFSLTFSKYLINISRAKVTFDCSDVGRQYSTLHIL